jgi:histidine phosphotransfer protein HptB
MPDDQIVDLQAIEALRALSPDDGGAFLRELIEIYLQDTPNRLAELEQALASKDAPVFTRAAHTIKGSSSNFGAGRLSKLALEIELQGKTGNLPASADSCARLKAEYALVAQALTKVAKGS